MRAQVFNQDAFIALTVVAIAFSGTARVQGGGNQPGEKIQFSEMPTASPVVVSNLNRLTPSDGGFKQVKEDLLRPFGSLDSQNSILDNALAAPLPMPQRPAQAPLSRRSLEMLDKRRNWAFSSYEDLYSPQGEMEKRMFGIKEYGADGQDKRAMSVVDKYYDSLDVKHMSATNLSAEDARAEFIIQNGFDPLGKSFHPGNPSLKESFRIETTEEAAGIGESTASVKPADLAESGVKTTKDYRPHHGQPTELDLMRQNILGDAALPVVRPADANNSSLWPPEAASLQNSKNSAQNLLNQFSDGASKPKSVNPFVVNDPTANVLHSHINDDLTAKALGLPNPTTTTTTFTNGYNSRPAPSAQSVEALTDPFGANRPKPRF